MKKIIGFVIAIAIILSCVFNPIYSATIQNDIAILLQTNQEIIKKYVIDVVKRSTNVEYHDFGKNYDPTHWNGLLELILEQGSETGQTGINGGDNSIGIINLISEKKAIFNFKAILTGSWLEYCPPAVLITNKSDYSYGGVDKLSATNINSIRGTVIVYRQNRLSDVQVFYIGADGKKSLIVNEINLSTVTPTPEITASPVSTATPVPIPSKDRVYLNFSYAYLYGYESGGVGADDTIKREEASALLYRLLKQNDKLDGFSKPDKATFSDVATNRWSFSAIEYMASIEVFDTTNPIVKPGAIVTRGEASKIIAYSMGLKPDEAIEKQFTDLEVDNVYYSTVKALIDAGLLRGYEDNTIRPDGYLTRAEYVTMINRLIGRDEKYDISALSSIYSDISPEYWAYKDIMRASLGFSDDGKGNYKIDPKKKLKRSEIDYN